MGGVINELVAQRGEAAVMLRYGTPPGTLRRRR